LVKRGKIAVLGMKSYSRMLWGALVLLGLYLTSLHNYLLFHSLAEIFSVVIAGGMFIVAWNARQLLEEKYLLLLGIAYVFIGGLDLVHTLAYTGMGVFPGYETNLPTQLWIAARYVESLSLLVAPLFLGRRIRVGFVFVAYGVITALLLGAIFYWDVFPACFVEGRGLTPFKKISEYAICLVLLGSIATFLGRREHLDPGVVRLLIVSIAATIASELAFTLYFHAYGLPNLVGHYLKIVSFYLIYKAVIETGLQRPYTVLFRDLKQREEDLQESDENLRAILNSSTASVFLTDTAGTIVALNETSARRLGKNADELVGSCLYDALARDVSKARRLRIEEVIREGTPVRFEDQRDGRWYGHSVYPVFDGDGKVRRLAIYARDITEHKEAEEELRKLSRAVEHSPASVVITDVEGTIQYVNPKFVEITGYTAAEAIGQNPRILKSGEQPPELYRELWETLARGEQWKGEFLNKKKNGDLYWEDASISPIRNDEGVITYFVGIKLDITDRKKAEEALQSSEHRYRTLFKDTIVGIVSSGADSKILAANPSVARIMGYQSPDELIGKPGEVLWFDPKDRAGRVEEAKLLGHTDPQEVILKKKDGTPVYALASATIDKGQSGEFLGMTKTFTNVTDRKKAEEELQKAHNELERRVEERTAELSKAIAQLRQQIKQRRKAEKELQQSQEEYRLLAGKLLAVQEAERRRLARELHDDFTQRLAVLAIEAGKIELQLQDSATQAPERLRDMKEEMVKLSGDVHAISRQLHPSILEDLGLVDAISSECTGFTEREGIVAEFAPTDIPPGIPNDVALCMYRITQEGLKNVAKHAQATKVMVSLIGKDNSIGLSIQDNGVGFAPARAKKKGGLGLASMKERVHLIQGSITVRSKPGQGTEINVRAPLKGA
jgi:PAS domain S-box-containing protein